MTICNIGTFPLLFTNKQIHNEVVGLVYSAIDVVEITPLLISHWEDWREFQGCWTPMSRWSGLKFARNWGITFYEDFFIAIISNWKGMKKGVMTRKRYSPWPNIPDMIKYLNSLYFLVDLNFKMEVVEYTRSWQDTKVQDIFSMKDIFDWLLVFDGVKVKGGVKELVFEPSHGNFRFILGDLSWVCVRVLGKRL